MEVYVKLSKFGRQMMLAICDTKLLGKTLHDDGIVFKVKEEFYQGFKTSIEEALDLIEQNTIVNMIGNDIVIQAVNRGLVHPEAVMMIDKIRHAHILKV